MFLGLAVSFFFRLLVNYFVGLAVGFFVSEADVLSLKSGYIFTSELHLERRWVEIMELAPRLNWPMVVEAHVTSCHRLAYHVSRHRFFGSALVRRSCAMTRNGSDHLLDLLRFCSLGFKQLLSQATLRDRHGVHDRAEVFCRFLMSASQFVSFLKAFKFSSLFKLEHLEAHARLFC